MRSPRRGGNRIVGRRPGARALAMAVAVGLPGAATVPVHAETPEPIHPTFEGLERHADAEATFDANSYEIIHVESTSVGVLWNSTTRWWRPVRGVYRMPTTYGDFYRALGRPDLAAREEARHATAEVLFWGGLLLIAGGVVGGGYQLYHQHTVGAIVGAGVAVGGYVSVSIGGALSRPAMNEEDAQDLAARYDRALGQRLGVSVRSSF